MTDVLAWADDHPKAKVLGRTRAAIVAAARDLFLQLGFERTTMEGVASEAGIGLMTLYRHFRAKPALFSTVMEAECGMIDLVPDPDALWSRPPEEALQLFGVAIISVMASPRLVALRRVVIAEAQRFPALGRGVARDRAGTRAGIGAAVYRGSDARGRAAPGRSGRVRGGLYGAARQAADDGDDGIDRPGRRRDRRRSGERVADDDGPLRYK